MLPTFQLGISHAFAKHVNAGNEVSSCRKSIRPTLGKKASEDEVLCAFMQCECACYQPPILLGMIRAVVGIASINEGKSLLPFALHIISLFTGSPTLRNYKPFNV